MHHRGFTVWEALLIIFAVLVLAAVLFPVFAHRHRRNPSMVCMNNQRQIAIAIQMYVQDQNQVYFPAPQQVAWSSHLAQYDGNDKLYNCQSSTFKGTVKTPEYGFNAALYGKPLSSVTDPANTLLLTEIDARKLTGSDYAVTLNPQDPHYFGTLVDPRHSKTFIVACTDGHMTMITARPGTDIPTALTNAGITPDPAKPAPKLAPKLPPPTPTQPATSPGKRW